jgi:hypothetical protein
MNNREAIIQLYKIWEKDQNEHYVDDETLNTFFSEKEKRCVFLSNAIIGITTYDDGLDLEFGKMILETLNTIQKKQTFEYIENKENYRKYILSCNFIKDWLDWGSSIRGAWFNTNDGKLLLMNIWVM